MPRASSFQAFSTRCGKSISSTDSSFVSELRAPTLYNTYVSGWTEPVWDETVNVSTWDDLKAEVESTGANRKKKITVTADISKTAYNTIQLPSNNNMVIMIASTPGSRFTIDIANRGDFLKCDYTSAEKTVSVILEDLIITNVLSIAVQLKYMIGYLLISNCVFTNSAAMSNTPIYLQEVTSLIVKDSAFDSSIITGEINFTNLNSECDVLLYNSSFTNMADGAVAIETYYEASISVLGCYFSGNIGSGLSVLIDVDTYVDIVNSVFAGNDGIAISLINYGTPASRIMDCEISNNTITGLGGAISLSVFNAVSSAEYEIGGDTCITGNTADDGAGVYVSNSIPIGGQTWSSVLSHLTVASTVTFSNNTASQSFLIADADKPVYATKVFVTQFSNGFEYGWNNADIHYKAGTGLATINVPVDGCPAQTVPTNTLGQINPLPTLMASCLGAYTFGGWFKDAPRTIAVTTTTIFISGDVLYPKLTDSTHTITLDPQNGAASSSVTTNADDTINDPGTPTIPSGATFGGWWTTAQTGGVKWTAAMTFTADATLYGRWTCSTGYTYDYATKTCAFTGCPADMAENGSGVCCWVVEAGDGTGGYVTLLVEPGDGFTAIDDPALPPIADDPNGPFAGWVFTDGTPVVFPWIPTESTTIEPYWSCAAYYISESTGCVFTGCPAGQKKNSADVCSWIITVITGAPDPTEILVVPTYCINEADMPSMSDPANGTFTGWQLTNGTTVTFPLCPTSALIIKPKYVCDVGYTPNSTGCVFTGCPAGMQLDGYGVCAWVITIDDVDGTPTTTLVEPGGCLNETDMPVTADPPHGVFVGWFIGSTQISFPYCPTGSVHIKPKFTCDAYYVSHGGECWATVKTYDGGTLIRSEEHPIGFVYTFHAFPSALDNGEYIGWEVRPPVVTKGYGQDFGVYQPGDTVEILESIAIHLLASCNVGWSLTPSNKCGKDGGGGGGGDICQCCDCLNPDLKVAFETLTTSVGGSHDAVGYIMQVIADKLTDPANTCELADFHDMLDKLTKLTGYNKNEMCCILSAMTGMNVGGD